MKSITILKKKELFLEIPKFYNFIFPEWLVFINSILLVHTVPNAFIQFSMLRGIHIYS